jgi:hypothetical protein
MKNSGTFIKSLQPADANNIVLLIDFNQILAPYQEYAVDNIIEHTIILEDLQAKVGLFSLLEAGWEDTNALASRSAEEAALAKIKKEGQKVFLGIYHAYGNGPWIKKGEEILQNKNSLEQPWALMAPFFSTNVTALLDEDLKIGVKIESKAQGVGGLKATDYITIFGSWRKNTAILRKKKDDTEAVWAAIEALELALAGRLTEVPANTLLGRNTGTGIVEAIPQSTFTKPADVNTAIDTAISAIIGGAPGALNTLDELAAALADDANFATTITNLLALKAPLANPNFTGFTTLGDNVAVKMKRLQGVTAVGQNSTQGNVATIPHGLNGDKIIWLGCKISHIVGGGIINLDVAHSGYSFEVYHDTQYVQVINHPTNSANISSKPLSILILYTS